jgi:hypothetical protein
MVVHLIAAAICVFAAAVMLRDARSAVARRAHFVVVAVMAVLVFATHSLALTLACAGVLTATTVVLLRRPHDREAGASAVDVAACGGLTMLMAVPLLLTTAGHAAAPGQHDHGMHAELHAAIPGSVDHQLLLALAAVGLVTTWALARRRLFPTATAHSSRAAWLMVAGMGLMALT